MLGARACSAGLVGFIRTYTFHDQHAAWTGTTDHDHQMMLPFVHPLVTSGQSPGTFPILCLFMDIAHEGDACRMTRFMSLPTLPPRIVTDLGWAIPGRGGR